MSGLKKQELEKELCDALGLKGVQKLDLHFEVGSFATAEVKMFLDDDQLKRIVSVVKKYNLKVDEATSQEQVSLSPTGFVIFRDIKLPEINDWSLNVDKFQIDRFICEEVNPCIDCNLFFPHIDDEPVIVCLQKAKSGELPTCKENCTKYLANNGTCPHYPTWLEDEDL